MDGTSGRISRGPGGRVKLEYVHAGRKRVALWEPLGSGIIETIYNEEGAVLRLSAFKKEGDRGMDACVENLKRTVSITSTVECDYSEIKLEKGCPACGARPLKRISAFAKESPTPLETITYECAECKGKSYYLTDEYLEQMMAEQATLFDQQERKEMEKNREAFRAKLKAWVHIRTFVPNKILQIN